MKGICRSIVSVGIVDTAADVSYACHERHRFAALENRRKTAECPRAACGYSSKLNYITYFGLVGVTSTVTCAMANCFLFSFQEFFGGILSLVFCW